MGIGNFIYDDDVWLVDELITPHGDRERSNDGPQEGRLLLLITPHGDREPVAGARPSSSSPVSLPLMGIGNLLVNSTDDLTLTSLPLMGSGTRCRASASLPCAAAHYPSWGSGTSGMTSSPSLSSRLITPHGDREPGSLARIAVPTFCSLPLMGIGNLGARYPCAQPLADLITPHGDRERFSGSSPPPSPRVSLPLMGIGNWTKRDKEVSL